MQGIPMFASENIMLHEMIKNASYVCVSHMEKMQWIPIFVFLGADSSARYVL